MDPPRYERLPRPNPKLEPLRDVIRRVLTNDHFIGSRILREIRTMGYDGSRVALYRFLAKLEAEEGKNKACIRYETSPVSKVSLTGLPTLFLLVVVLPGW